MELPIEIQSLVDSTTCEEVHAGESKSRVFRVSGKAGQRYFLKVSNSPYVAQEIGREVQILEWLSPRGISVSSKVALAQSEGFTYFLLTALDGRSMAEAAAELDSKDCMYLCATFLKRLHTVNIQDCPFNRRLSVTRTLAAANMKAGLIDETDFDQDHQKMSALQLFQDLLQDVQEDLVFTHGDYCLPNIILNDNHISGVIDLGRAGVADRYQDIGLFLRSFKKNLGEPDLNLFLDCYGLLDSFDCSKATFYRKLDEFF